MKDTWEAGQPLTQSQLTISSAPNIPHENSAKTQIFSGTFRSSRPCTTYPYIRYYASSIRPDTLSVSYTQQDDVGVIGLASVNSYVNQTGAYLTLALGGVATSLSHSYVQSPQIIQTSKAETKKNFEELSKGLDIVESAEVYSYNLKFEEDTDKKHYGFVIGEGYKTPPEVIAQSGDGIDTYSMCAIFFGKRYKNYQKK